MTLRGFLPHIVALLAGGLMGSLGLTYLARTRRLRPKLASAGGWRFATGAVVASAAAAAVAFVIARRALATGGAGLEGVTPPQLLLFGFLIGVPLSLPGLIFAWSEARGDARARSRRRDFVATRDDRRKFAVDLGRQIAEVSPKPRDVTASIGGEGGRILVLEGEIDPEEGERLTAALRADLSELGFKRVEGKGGSAAWWSRV